MKGMELYQTKAASMTSAVAISGRFLFQQDSMKKIVPEICRKLELKTSDKLLDIGCNVGEITIPLSFLCKSVVGIDGEQCIQKLKRRASGIENIFLYAGDFLKMDLDESFEKILAYSVIQYLGSYENIKKFVIKGARLLSKGG